MSNDNASSSGDKPPADSDEVRVLLAKALLAQSTAFKLQEGRGFSAPQSFLPDEPFYDATFVVTKDGAQLTAGGYSNEELIRAEETLVLVFRLSDQPQGDSNERAGTLLALADYLAQNTVGSARGSFVSCHATCSARHNSQR